MECLGGVSVVGVEFDDEVVMNGGFVRQLVEQMACIGSVCTGIEF